MPTQDPWGCETAVVMRGSSPLHRPPRTSPITGVTGITITIITGVLCLAPVQIVRVRAGWTEFFS